MDALDLLWELGRKDREIAALKLANVKLMTELTRLQIAHDELALAQSRSEGCGPPSAKSP